MADENKRIVRRYFEELDRRRATPVDLCAAGFTFYVAGFPPMDLEATTQFAAMFFNALPDLSHPLDELIRRGRRSPNSREVHGWQNQFTPSIDSNRRSRLDEFGAVADFRSELKLDQTGQCARDVVLPLLPGAFGVAIQDEE